MTSNPPTGEPEQRWQQPSFGPPPDEPQSSYQPAHLFPGAGVPARRVPPPSTLESVVGALAKVIWPLAIVLFIFTKAGFFPLLIVAMVAGAVLGAIKRNLRQRRYAAALPPDPPPLIEPPR